MFGACVTAGDVTRELWSTQLHLISGYDELDQYLNPRRGPQAINCQAAAAVTFFVGP
jgi:hypothetical protein